MLPDWSPEGLKANAAWLHEQRDKLAGFKDDQLDSVQRFQREYALAVIDGQLFWLEESGFPNSNPAFYAGDLSPSMSSCTFCCRSMPTARNARITTSVHTPRSRGTSPLG